MICKRLGLIICIAALAIAAAPMTARASVIYDNGGPENLGGWPSDVDSGFMVADDFQLQSGLETISDVHWWGSYSYTDTPQSTDSFTIRIFADNSGAPGTQVGSDITVSDAHRTDTGNVGSGSGSEVYSYSADISPITLTANTTYWLSIQNDTTVDTDDNWYWEVNDGNSGNAQGNAGGGWSNLGAELAFNLSNDGVVPEPASLTLLGLGLAGLAGRKLRKRA